MSLSFEDVDSIPDDETFAKDGGDPSRCCRSTRPPWDGFPDTTCCCFHKNGGAYRLVYDGLYFHDQRNIEESCRNVTGQSTYGMQKGKECNAPKFENGKVWREIRGRWTKYLYYEPMGFMC